MSCCRCGVGSRRFDLTNTLLIYFLIKMIFLFFILGGLVVGQARPFLQDSTLSELDWVDPYRVGLAQWIGSIRFDNYKCTNIQNLSFWGS